MIMLVIVVVVIAAIALLPAWLRSRGKGDSIWLLFVGVPSYVAWFVVTMLGFGPQSLSNLIELLILGTLSIVAGYIKVFLVDPYYAESSRNTYLVIVFLVLAAILLRKFMPLLPE